MLLGAAPTWFIRSPLLILLTVVFQFVSLSSAFSRSDTIDLRNQSVGPALVQSKGWCFAYAAADLISHRLGQRVSTEDVALSYYSRNRRSGAKRGFEGGWVEQAVSAALKNGVCLEKDFPTDPTNEDFHSYFLLATQTQAITGLKNIYDVRKKLWGKVDPDLPGFFVFPYLSYNDIMRVLKKGKFKEGEVAFALRDANCSGRTLNTIRLKAKTMTTGFFAAIDSQLELGNPVAISYFPSFLVKNPEELGRDIKGHASTIFGRKLHPDIRYLIRQSWAPNMKYAHNIEPDSLETGYIWVRAADLLPNLYGVTYIEN